MTENIQFIELLRMGDRESYNQLVDHYQHIVYNTILNIIQHPQDAEDVTQEVFVQVFRSVSKFRGDSKISTWIYRIAITKALEWERKKKSQKAIHYFKNLVGITAVEKEIPEFNHPGIALQQKENAALLFKALKQLPENQRIAFLLIKAEGMSYAEAGLIMEKSIKSIEGLVQRAKDQLRIILKEHNHI